MHCPVPGELKTHPDLTVPLKITFLSQGLSPAQQFLLFSPAGPTGSPAGTQAIHGDLPTGSPQVHLQGALEGPLQWSTCPP